jgi:hypothetical protein
MRHGRRESMQKKYQVFVSSTFRDLVDERQDAIRSILDLGHIPAGMELFPAADTEQLDYIKKVIDECDYYILIMGGRYGSLDDQGVSFTEREYDYAVQVGKTVLAFPHGNLANIPVGKSDTGDRMRTNLEQFRAKVMTGRLVREWTSREQLEALVVKAMVRGMSEYPATGWIRGDAVASEALLQQINELRVENDRLKSDNAELLNAALPVFDGLAPLDDTILVHSKWWSYRFSQIEEASTALTWRDILKAVGPDLAVPAPREVLKDAIAKYLREIHGLDSEAAIYDTDADLIQNQLEALGFLSLTSQQVGNGSPVAFLGLTEKGRMELMQSLALRAG